ncbi:MAG: hypothetical protein Q4F21_04885 [Lachnospiraceae bacterium]|nr:hypothetical protein [Lachnospiraceae bacterium]
MYEYSIFQWLIFFYIYCFFGWCFESAYVSVKKKTPVNRGFMHGPLLPLYGSGAVTVLFAALPFREFPAAVYLVGMTAATLLEYAVGVTMEALFKVRYWDYSNQKFNIQGHICLSSSIAWGFLSVALIYGMHEPIERFVCHLPFRIVNPAAILISMLAAADFAASLKTALDIRDLIVQAERMRTELGHMKRRVEIIDTFARAQLGARGEEILDRLEETVEERFGVEFSIKEQLQETREQFQEQLQETREHIQETKEQLSKDIIKMLKRNPGARASILPGFLEELREGIKEKNDEKKR